MTDAGVVHEDIDPSVPVDHAGNGAFPRPWIGHIQLLDMHPISLLARQHVVEPGAARHVPHGGDNRVPGTSERHRRGKPEARAATR